MLISYTIIREMKKGNGEMRRQAIYWLKIEILKPDVNKSFTKFTVDNGKIRFGLRKYKKCRNSSC